MKQKQTDYGSQYWLRFAINNARPVINRELAATTEAPADEEIEWISPLPPDFKEFQDQEFLDKLRLKLPKVQLNQFWPRGGPVWDALARTEKERIFLIEAKAHIPEINSPESGASSPSLKQIAKSLNETRTYLDADPIIDWTRTFFQYTNRIAHLYLLRELNAIDAYLVNIYFLNDKRMNGPSTIAEWKGALALLKTHLGVTRTKLSPFMKDLFIDIEELKSLSSNTCNLQVSLKKP
jgi:hypothetical protein